MNPQVREELLRTVAEMCRRYPHWRFGQLVSNISGWSDVDIWDVEDEQLLEAAREHLRQVQNQTE
jgi:hypothetical protein